MSVLKFGGRDCELSTTGISAGGESLDPWKVTSNVLRQMKPALATFGTRVWSRQQGANSYYANYSTDCLRHWSGAGQCFYSDLAHAEVCTASCLYPRVFAAQCLSTLLAMEAARSLAEQEADGEESYSLTTSNADVLDPAISFGTHFSMQVASSLWDDLISEVRHPAILGFVTSAIAAAIPFFGAGYLLPLSDGRTIYSLSGRAHHLSKIKTLSTTEAFCRGILNSRRERHGAQHERLHLIGFDFDVLSSALLFSLLQCILTAAEEGYCGMNLFDPVRALRIWSWGLDLQSGKQPAVALLVDGRKLTLPTYMRELATHLLRMCESGLIAEHVAPQAREMLPRIIQLATYAEEGLVSRCSRHLSWAAKLLWLMRLCDEDGATLGDATTRLADHDFANTNPEQGVLWRLWEADAVDPLVTLDEARACLVAGPPESRDWGRGRIIDRFIDRIADVDWSFVDLRRAGSTLWSPRLIELPLLDSLNQQQFQSVIENVADADVLHRLLQSGGDAVATRTDPLDDVVRQLAVVPRTQHAKDSNFDRREE